MCSICSYCVGGRVRLWSRSIDAVVLLQLLDNSWSRSRNSTRLCKKLCLGRAAVCVCVCVCVCVVCLVIHVSGVDMSH